MENFRQFIKREWLLLLIAFIPLLLTLPVWEFLPEFMPVHWGPEGRPDSLKPVYFLPLINIGVYFLMVVLPLVDPKKENYPLFGKSYFRIRLAFLLFLSAVCIMNIGVGLGHEFDRGDLIFKGVWALIAILGNYMGTIRSNWFVGIKTPWTLADETVWKQTHVMAGRVWFWTGTVFFTLSFSPLDVLARKAMIFTLIGVGVVWPIVYSYFVYRKVGKTDSN